MYIRTKLYFLIILLLIITFSQSFAQFYNGLQMDFGKNRVQYNDFYWQYYRFKRFDTYFYVDGKELAQFTGKIAEKKIAEIENFFEYTLDKRIIFIIYNKLSDFRQSNIGLVSGSNQYNIGGVTKIVGNRVFIFFDGDHKKIEQQISAAITEVLLNEMLYGSDFKSKVANSTLLNLPEWYIEGLISYVSENWDIEIENKVKDGILCERYEKFNRLTGEDAVYAGHSIWNFIAETYGKSVIPNIVYLTRISKNVESGFMFVLGISLKYLSYEWLNYYDKKYYEDDKNRSLPDAKSMLTGKKPKKNRVYKQIKISPAGNYIAYVTNELGQYKLWLYSTETHKHKRILKKEHKLDQITDYSYPILAWHPTGELLTFITERKGKILLSYYILSSKKIETKELFYFEKILDFSYSHDGLNLVFSAVQKGQTDIFVHNLAANTNEQITKDLADDFYPRFFNNSKQIIFSSNRTSDTIIFEEKKHNKTALTHDIFIYDEQNKSSILTRLSNTPYINESYPYEIKKNIYNYLNDDNGIINRQIAKYDSTISFIDTTIHYRFFIKSEPVSNYSRNILEIDINAKSRNYAEILYSDGKYKMFFNKFDLIDSKNSFSSPDAGINTEFRSVFTQKLIMQDSLRNAKPQSTDKAQQDSSTTKRQSLQFKADTTKAMDSQNIDVNNYIFEKEKKKSSYYPPTTDSLSQFDSIYDGFKIPKQLIYFTSFYTNYIVNQVDFGFLNSSYQAFTGGAVYFNPGFNVLFKIGSNDLFENYKITGGVRFAGNFDSNEYLLSFENLQNRIDKQIIFHRQAFSNVMAYSLSKTHTHELMYILKYPFNQVTSVKLTGSTRYDRSVYLSTDFQNLKKPNTYKVWAGLKLEYIFDNTINKGLNLYNGSRFKLFGEAYKQVNEDKSDLFVLGADFRHYQRIHRSLIWASRFATSTSFGNSRLIYYLGSIDNWINLSSKIETFDYSVPINTEQNYAYQTIATNMRGFTQNIRNGNSFALINNEIRWPIIRYFTNRPINSDFLANFQVVGFADIGTAWCGSSPYSDENAYNKEIIESGPITVVIDKDKNPIVAGYGFGVRSRLLGYFVRADWAWGIENNIILPRIFYLSLSLDF